MSLIGEHVSNIIIKVSYFHVAYRLFRTMRSGDGKLVGKSKVGARVYEWRLWLRWGHYDYGNKLNNRNEILIRIWTGVSRSFQSRWRPGIIPPVEEMLPEISKKINYCVSQLEPMAISPSSSSSSCGISVATKSEGNHCSNQSGCWAPYTLNTASQTLNSNQCNGLMPLSLPFQRSMGSSSSSSSSSS